MDLANFSLKVGMKLYLFYSRYALCIKWENLNLKE